MSVTENELKERATAPRVTIEYLESQIVSEYTFTGASATTGCPIHESLGCLTFCILVLKNGFTVTGQSACADPANFDRDIGNRLARKDAIGKIWPLLGYELRTKLALAEVGTRPSDPIMQTYVGTKVVHAFPMMRANYNILRGWQLPADEDGSDDGYLVEYADGGQGNVRGFTGYVSWSPKTVFEKSYAAIGVSPAPATVDTVVATCPKPESTWLDRLRVEQAEISVRVANLRVFKDSDVFASLKTVEQHDLREQLFAMEKYLKIVGYRLARADEAAV